jgi:hypothetical protein
MILTRNKQGLRENLSQCHFVHCKSHMDYVVENLGFYGEKLVTNHVSYGMDSKKIHVVIHTLGAACL